MAESIVQRIKTLGNGYLPAQPKGPGDAVGKTRAGVTVDLGMFWADMRKYGFAGMVCCAMFYALYQVGGWAGTKTESAVVWSGQNVIKPTVDAQVKLQDTLATLVDQQAADGEKLREVLRQNSEAMQLMHQSIQELRTEIRGISK